MWDDLCQLGARRSFDPGDHLVFWGADEHGLMAIESGVCKIVNSTVEGRQTLATVRGPGEILGEISTLTGSSRSSSVVALSPVDVVMISGADFDRWLDHEPGAGRKLATMLAERVAETTRFGIGSQRRVDVRLADRILFLVDRFGAVDGEGEVDLHTSLTHEDLAAWVGATRAVTTRGMGTLRDLGHLDFGRGWIRVRDRCALETFCQER